MTESQSLVERLAGEAGFDTELGEIGAPECYDGDVMDVRKLLEKFAELVADHCALTVEVMFAGQVCPTRAEMEAAAKNVADGIRQRFGVGE